MVDFFTKEEGDQIISAIRHAELNTSAEIRVHLEEDCNQRTFLNAIDVFEKLGMHKTKLRNGVLLFIVPYRKEFSILGDLGINNKVGEGYWADVCFHVQKRFRTASFAQGICEGIHQIGQKLKIHFPFENDDINELPDEISYGKK